MRLNVAPGRYVLAVSGGVDSMVLLDLLLKRPEVELIVAHFNHGIRTDAGQDEELVRNRAKEQSLPFETGYGHLGAQASEAAARNARYGFLYGLRDKYKAGAVITAHHLDDKLETALLNILRGTGRRGLSSLSSRPGIIRPLLNTPKKDLVSYAKANDLRWREDTSNANPDYLRNYLRHNVMPKISAAQKQVLICNLEKVAKTNSLIDKEIAKMSRNITRRNVIDRTGFSNLPQNIGAELLSYWLRELNAGEFDRQTVSRLSLALKTSRAGTIQPVKQGAYVNIGRHSAFLKPSLKVSTGLV